METLKSEHLHLSLSLPNKQILFIFAAPPLLARVSIGPRYRMLSSNWKKNELPFESLMLQISYFVVFYFFIFMHAYNVHKFNIRFRYIVSCQYNNENPRQSLYSPALLLFQGAKSCLNL